VILFLLRVLCVVVLWVFALRVVSSTDNLVLHDINNVELRVALRVRILSFVRRHITSNILF